MASNPLRFLLHDLRRATRLHEGAEQTDSQLLDAFRRGRDPLALEVLIRRHAPMVWGVCRRTLANHQEAEDAFQATFLVLLRKAASIRTPELLPNWLYRVAYKTACKARQTAAKRGSREKQVRVLPEPPAGPHPDTFGLDLRDVLDEELRRLPEKYRIVVILCDLEDKTRHEAARELRLPEGTVASRLATGRALLAKLLLRRGFGVSATSLAAAGFQQAAPGAVPAGLLANTVRAVGLLAAGETVAVGLISTEAPPLAEAVLRATAVAKLKRGAAWLIVATLALAGGLEAVGPLTARPDQPPPAPPVPGEVRPFPAPVALREIRRFPVEEVAWGVSFSPDSRQALIATGGRAPVRACDVSSGKEVLRTGAYDSCWGAAYSPDGKAIAVGSGGQPIQVLDALTGQVQLQWRFGAGRVRNVAFSPDGLLVATSHADGHLLLLDLVRRRAAHVFRADNNAVHSAAFTPDGKHVLVIDPDQTLRLYEIGSGKEVRQFEGHTARVIDVAISADGRHGFSCGGDKTLRLWDLETGKELRCIYDPGGGLHGVALCPDGFRALSASNKTVRLWDLTTGQELHHFDGHEGAVVCVAVSPDGRYALSGSEDHTARLWRLPAPAPAPEAP